MAPKSKVQSKKPKVTKKVTASAKVKTLAPKITLEELDAISSSDDDDDDDGYPGEKEWDAEALALRQAIKDGAFDHLLEKSNDDDDEDIKEVSLDDEMEDDEDEVADDLAESNEVDEDEPPDEENDGGDDDDDDDEDVQVDDEEEGMDEQDEDDSDAEAPVTPDWGNGKALVAVTKELEVSRKDMPWAESFSIIAETPLPFGVGEAMGNPLDVHDDLKREVAFYNMALEAANMARKLCHDANVPFSRPEDFFAEMVKTDDHMAKVKDRLIFETKKMDAVVQRKSNKEQKLRAKEAHANKIAEKSKKKKEHFAQVDQWAKSAANHRGGALQDDQDEAYLGKMQKPGFKRQNANKKFGFGGKTGRFKQNSASSINDMKGFNPKGNFAGGKKGKSSGGGKGGSGAARQGKRARDAKRSK